MYIYTYVCIYIYTYIYIIAYIPIYDILYDTNIIMTASWRLCKVRRGFCSQTLEVQESFLGDVGTALKPGVVRKHHRLHWTEIWGAESSGNSYNLKETQNHMSKFKHTGPIRMCWSAPISSQNSHENQSAKCTRYQVSAMRIGHCPASSTWAELPTWSENHWTRPVKPIYLNPEYTVYMVVYIYIHDIWWCEHLGSLGDLFKPWAEPRVPSCAELFLLLLTTPRVR